MLHISAPTVHIRQLHRSQDRFENVQNYDAQLTVFVNTSSQVFWVDLHLSPRPCLIPDDRRRYQTATYANRCRHDCKSSNTNGRDIRDIANI